MRDALGDDEIGDGDGIGCVDLGGAEPTGAAVVAIHDALGSAAVVESAKHDVLVEVPTGGDGRERRADAPGAHHQDLHGAAVYRRSRAAIEPSEDGYTSRRRDFRTDVCATVLNTFCNCAADGVQK